MLARAVSAAVILGSFQVVAQPQLPPQNDLTIAEQSFLRVTNTSITGTNLTYQLLHPPSGATITANGIIAWSPLENQGPTNVTFTTIVIDDALQFDTNSFIVHGHAYMVIGYDAVKKQYELANPWGYDTDSTHPAIVWETWANIRHDFDYWTSVML